MIVESSGAFVEQHLDFENLDLFGNQTSIEPILLEAMACLDLFCSQIWAVMDQEVSRLESNWNAEMVHPCQESTLKTLSSLLGQMICLVELLRLLRQLGCLGFVAM